MSYASGESGKSNAGLSVKTVSSKDLFDPVKNPTTCLSACREFNTCHKCDVYVRAHRRNEESKLKCKPHLDEKAKKLMDEIRAKRQEARDLEKALDHLKTWEEDNLPRG